MGEQADYIIDSLWDKDHDNDDAFMAPATYCKYCKTFPLYWAMTEDGKWRLFSTTGKLHKCQKYNR